MDRQKKHQAMFEIERLQTWQAWERNIGLIVIQVKKGNTMCMEG